MFLRLFVVLIMALVLLGDAHSWAGVAGAVTLGAVAVLFLANELTDFTPWGYWKTASAEPGSERAGKLADRTEARPRSGVVVAEPAKGSPPPSASKARVWTILSAFWLWLLLPVAVHYQRKARQEAEESGGRYEWPRTIWNRPVVLWVIVFGASMTILLLMVFLGVYGDPRPKGP